MPTDLYTLFKKIERRARVDPDDFLKWELNELALEVLLNRSDRSELLAITAKMFEVERQLPFHHISFSLQMQRSIEADDYVFRGRPRTENAADFGCLFIAAAWSRPGLAKLGATYDVPQDRAARYAERYGYPVNICFSASVRRPFSLQAALDRKLSDLAVPNETYGDSLGWYRMKPEELQIIVERELEGS